MQMSRAALLYRPWTFLHGGKPKLNGVPEGKLLKKLETLTDRAMSLKLVYKLAYGPQCISLGPSMGL